MYGADDGSPWPFDAGEQDLSLSPDQVPADHGLVEFVFGSQENVPHEVTVDSVLQFKPKIVEWVKNRGGVLGPEQAAGFTNEIEKIASLVSLKADAEFGLAKAKAAYTEQAAKIHKAKQTMLVKWKSMSTKDGVDCVSSDPVQQLDEWETEKLACAKQPVVESEKKLSDVETQVNEACVDLMKVLKPEEVDPECDVLMKELESTFEHMFIKHPTKEMNAATAAIENIQALQDGSAKTSLFAALEAVATTPSPKAQMANNKLKSKKTCVTSCGCGYKFPF